MGHFNSLALPASREQAGLSDKHIAAASALPAEIKTPADEKQLQAIGKLIDAVFTKEEKATLQNYDRGNYKDSGEQRIAALSSQVFDAVKTLTERHTAVQLNHDNAIMQAAVKNIQMAQSQQQGRQV